MPKQFSKIPAAVLHATPSIKGLEALVFEAQKGNIQARDKVVTAFLPWIASEARIYAQRANRFDLLEDMKQAAICGNSSTSLGGLLRAIQDYKENGAAFYRYAIIWINKAFQDIMSTGVAGSTRRTFEMTNRIRSMARDIEHAFGRPATPDDIRRAATEKAIAVRSDEEIWDALSTATEVNQRHGRRDPSVAQDGLTYLMTVQAPYQDDAVDDARDVDKIGTILAKASPQARDVFLAAYEDGMSHDEIAATFNIPKRKVKYIIERLRNKVRAKVRR